MKIVEFSEFGVPHEVAHVRDVPDVGNPAPGEVVYEVLAFPINPVDLLTMSGQYAVRPALPACIGAESLGQIVAVGDGVGDLAPGQRVIDMGRDNWAQHKKVPATNLIRVPNDVDPLQLSMLKVNPPTALLMLRNFVELGPGDWVIQNAANSAVGTLLIRFAHAAGIRTVNVVRRGELIEPLKSIGADDVLVDDEHLSDRVAEATDGARIRLAIDAVGGTAITRLADCVEEEGVVVNYGLLSGEDCRFTAHQLVFKRITATGFWLMPALVGMSGDEREKLYADLADRVRAGDLHVDIEKTYGIDDIKTALEHAGSEGRGGKILVTPNGPLLD